MKKPTIYIVTTLFLIGLVIGGVVYYSKYNEKKPTAAVEIPSQSSTQIDTTDQTTNTPLPVTNQKTTSNTPPPPLTPTLTKSSGNNGPVPAGSNMNFICSAEPNIDCSVILIYSGKQIVLGPSKVTDNGRGQYFASFYWASVKGSYTVTAQAKNSQGGVSSSISQKLDVQ